MIPYGDLSIHLDLVPQSVRTLVTKGIFTRDMSLDAIRIAYIRYLRSFITGVNRPRKDDSQITPGSLDFEKIRLTKAQADNMELKNQISQGEVAPIELIERVIASSSAEAAGLLDSLPLVLKRKHPELSSQLLESIKAHVVKTQNAIARANNAVEPVLQEYIRGLEAG